MSSQVFYMTVSVVVLLKQAKVSVPRQQKVELNPAMLSSDHSPGLGNHIMVVFLFWLTQLSA